jgi:hypothetical protein
MKTLFLITCLYLISCSSFKENEHSFNPEDLIFTKEDFYRNPKTKLNSEEIKKDIDLLIYALDKGYGGRNFLPEKIIQDTFANLSKIKIENSLSEKEFCDKIGDILWQVPDGHLTVKSREELCGDQAKWHELKGRVGKNSKLGYFQKNNKPWFVGKEKMKGKIVGLISIISFPSSKNKIWDGFIDESRKLLNMDIIIIDLRGNRGGDDTFGFKLAELLQDRKVMPGWDKTIDRLSPETIALSKNNLIISKLNLIHRNNPIPAYISEYLKDRENKLRLSKKGKLPEEKVYTWSQKDHPLGNNMFNGKIIILADKECGSSGESSLEALAKHPNATFYGENTAGKYHFGNVAVLILPNSKISIGVASKYNAYKDNRNIDKIGLRPDVKTKTDEDAIKHEGLFD